MNRMHTGKSAVEQNGRGKKVSCGGQDECDGGGGWPVGLNWFCYSACLGNRLLKVT